MTQLSVCCRFHYPSGFRITADFSVDKGTTTIVGPSGGGKSTVVALIAGLLVPQEGTIRFSGRTFSDTERTVPPHRRNVGVAFQDGRLFPHLSVRKNLLYGRRRFRAAHPTVADIVGTLELGGLLDRRPASLSGGQRQRVALGRALLTGAELLLLDEPVSAIDLPLRRRVLDFIRDLIAETGQTCLVVTHDTATAERLTPGTVVTVTGGRAVTT